VSLLMVFWDGVGIGRKNPRTNPLVAAKLPSLRELFGGEIFTLGKKKIMTSAAAVVPLDATFGLEGLPQSGTGQAAIFAGIDVAGTIGIHFGPYAPASLRNAIRERSVFQQLKERGFHALFANAYPNRYFDYLASPRAKYPVVALANISAGMPLNSHVALAAGNAVSADIVATRWKEFGHPDIEPLLPGEAGLRFYRMGARTDFILFEYFLTDKAGHEQSMSYSIEILERFDAFLSGMLESFDRRHDTLLIVSDHGNIEDLSTKSHTRNAVPFIVVGAGKKYFLRHVRSLSDITPAVVSYCELCGKINRQ
jgi:2,3-bisphosphoglycerate-independent phosphoglycerate mutase